MRTIILGFDAFDPMFCERLLQDGRLPNLARYLNIDGYRRFEVANPPQSEVSWSSIATGLNPGGHGIFDFVHRDPGTYTPFVSLLPTKRSLGGIQFAPPFTAKTLFDHTATMGFPAVSLFWPATFPARPDSLVKTIPGLGTPDIHGKLGVGTFFSTSPPSSEKKRKTPAQSLVAQGKNRFQASLKGPYRGRGGKDEASSLSFVLENLDDLQGKLTIGPHSIQLQVGNWSPIFDLTFKLGTFVNVRVLTRAILTSLDPEVSLYFLPLQLDPLHSPWHYAVPPKFVKSVWKEAGPFLTIGWPQDTTGLEDGFINDQQFLDLCDSIFDSRERILMHQVAHYQEGVLAAVFDSLDRVQHMFWRDRPDIIEGWYIKLDALVGRLESAISKRGLKNTRILVISDHGFSRFDQKIHLNRWLIDKDYLFPHGETQSGNLKEVDWQKSRAYGLGLNSIYLNREGREGQGVVNPTQGEALVEQIRDELLSWTDSQGNKVVNRVTSNSETFSGALAEYGPDIIVGYAPGFRGSAETGLGEWVSESIEKNLDHWSADHCIDSESVPGVLFCNQGLGNLPEPSYRDIPMLATGEGFESGGGEPPPTFSSEDQEMLEERLKSLGYL